MWRFVHMVVFALALAGFVGQSSAHATPLQVLEAGSDTAAATMAGPAMAAMPDCPEMAAMAQAPAPKSKGPCHDMTPDCMAKMGCAAVATTLPAPAAVVSPSVAARTTNPRPADTLGDGAGPPPLRGPPKSLA